MPQSYTLEQLQKMGAKPKSYTLEELQGMGAKPAKAVQPQRALNPKRDLVASPSVPQQSEGESFFSNTPQPGTLGYRADEAIINVAEPFSARDSKGDWRIPPIVQGAIDIGKAGAHLISANPLKGVGELKDIAAGMVHSAVDPLGDYIKAVGAGDWDAAAGASGRILAQTVPAVAGAVEGVRGIRAVAGSAAEAAPGMYQKALQPSPRTYSAGEIRDMAKTGLENKIPVSRSGLNRLDTLVNDLNASIASDIAKNPTAPVSKFKVAARLSDTAKKVANQVNPESDLATVSDTGNEFLRTQPNDIPAATAQELKKGTYRQVGDKAMGGEVTNASVRAQKALAKGLKEELEGIFPEIKLKNAAEGKLLDLQPELEAAVNRMGNRRISLANAVNVLADPAVTSRIAIYLNKLGMPPAVVQARLAAALKAAVPATVATSRRDALEVLGQPTP